MNEPSGVTASCSDFRIPWECGRRTEAGVCVWKQDERILFLAGLALPTRRKAGRDGQIRTADLSLRRRPLYPSELRPHTNVLIVAFQTLGSNIARVVHLRCAISRHDPWFNAAARLSALEIWAE